MTPDPMPADATDLPAAPPVRRGPPPGRTPPPPLVTRADFPQLAAALREGRESFRQVANRFGISVSSAHGLSRELAEHDAARAGTPLPEPPPKPPVPTLAEALAAGCPVCSWPIVELSHLNRALFGTPSPDLQRIAAAFKVSVPDLKTHWSHTTTPAEFVPPAPQPAPRWTPSTPPCPLPTTPSAAAALVAERGAAVAPAITAWARLEYSRFCSKWNGPSAHKDSIHWQWSRSIANAAPASILLATAEFLAQLLKLAATDGDVLAFREAQGRLAAHAARTPAFDATGFLRVLAQRGCTTKLDNEGKIVVSNSGSLNSVDREILARHRNDIASTLATTEVF